MEGIGFSLFYSFSFLEFEIFIIKSKTIKQKQQSGNDKTNSGITSSDSSGRKQAEVRG